MAGRGTDILLGGNPDVLARAEVEAAAAAHRFPRPTTIPKPATRSIPKPTSSNWWISQERYLRGWRSRRFKAEVKTEHDAVIDLGGLFILGTERHESRRIDNQLRGRSGRQGDPGMSRFYLSLEDDLMRIFGSDRIKGMMETLGMKDDEQIEHRWLTRAIEGAQKKVEGHNFDIRKNLLEYDDVMNQQRHRGPSTPCAARGAGGRRRPAAGGVHREGPHLTQEGAGRSGPSNGPTSARRSCRWPRT